MYTATNEKPLATTITGSLPRPSWFGESLERRPFSLAFAGDAAFREQYSDAVAALISDQTRAGLDIVSDGEMRFDMDVGGRSWFGYLFDRMDGLAPNDSTTRAPGSDGVGRGGAPGDILNEFRQTLLPPQVVGPIGAGKLQYDEIWKVAQRLTPKPVKMGSCSGQMLDRQVVDRFHKNKRDSLFAFARALNEEYHRLADAGCLVIQIEEPCVHSAFNAAVDVPVETYVDALNLEVKGLREKTEVWCHTCWGNPFAQRLAAGASYKPALPYLDRLDVDVITFETAENDGAELPEICAAISKDKKICIGVVKHRSLQVETPDEVASLIRKALRHVEPERLLLSSDCGFGRQGMSRVHAFYKMVAMVRGVNIVRDELGLPQAEIPASNPRYA
jgi:5-methyltetrahydropteroyltriglutamate--homocysteine methyltransferase